MYVNHKLIGVDGVCDVGFKFKVTGYISIEDVKRKLKEGEE